MSAAPAIVKTMEQTFLHLGVAVPKESAMRATIGLPLQRHVPLLEYKYSDENRGAVSPMLPPDR